MEEGENRSQ